MVGLKVFNDSPEEGSLNLSAVLLCDYFLVRRKVGYNVYQMYKPHGLYWYLAGVNSRAVLAFIVGMVPQLPGLVHQINAETKGISAGYVNFSSLGWVEGLVFSGSVLIFKGS